MYIGNFYSSDDLHATGELHVSGRVLILDTE